MTSITAVMIVPSSSMIIIGLWLSIVELSGEEGFIRKSLTDNLMTRIAGIYMMYKGIELLIETICKVS